MLESALALAVPHNVGRPHLRSAPEQARPGPSTKGDYGPPYMGGMSDPRQTFGEPLHPQPIEIDLDQFCSELPAPGDRHLRLGVADRRRVMVRLSKGPHSARRHLSLAGDLPHMCLMGEGAKIVFGLIQVNAVTKISHAVNRLRSPTIAWSRWAFGVGVDA